MKYKEPNISTTPHKLYHMLHEVIYKYRKITKYFTIKHMNITRVPGQSDPTTNVFHKTICA